MNFLLIIVMIISSYLDIKSYIVYTPLNITILLLAFFKHVFYKENLINIIFGLIVIPLILIILNYIKKDSIGDGDIEYLSALGFYFGYKMEVYAFFIGIFMIFIYSILIKKDKYPLIPFISIGFIAILLI